jgi:hypothetical protein
MSSSGSGRGGGGGGKKESILELAKVCVSLLYCVFYVLLCMNERLGCQMLDFE